MKEMSSMFDMKSLGKLKRLDENAPETMKAFWSFDKAAFLPGTIDVLHKQLTAVAVALTTQCPYCIEVHAKAAKAAGASRAELVEAAFIAAALRAGGAATHGAMALKFFDGES